MKRSGIALIILMSALTFGGCKDVSERNVPQNSTSLSDTGRDSAQTSPAVQQQEKDFAAAALPEPIQPDTSSASTTDTLKTPPAPQGNCPDCGGTGHHNGALCDTCHGTGSYEKPAAPQGNCPNCGGTGHHNGSLCDTCNGTGYCNTQTAPQATSGGCHNHNSYQSGGHHGGHHY